jgi:hypothetical protein
MQFGDAGKVDLDASLLSSDSPPVNISNQQSELPRSGPPAGAAPPTAATVSGILAPPALETVRTGKTSLVRRKLLIVWGTVICAVLALAAGVAALRPLPVESYVATAAVRVASTNIYSKPSPLADKIASVSMGAPLHVLSLPTSRDQEWIGVQRVTPKVMSPGYVRTADLRDWSGLTGAAALTLIRTLSPSETGSEEEIRARIESLNNLKSRFAGEPAAKEAGLDVTRLRLALAQRHKAAGMSPEDWQSDLKAARQELDLIAGEGNLRAQILELTGQMEALLAVPIPPIPPQSATALPPPPDVSALLAQARQLRQDGDFPGALTLVERVLRIRPGNKDAQALREKIRKAYDAEKK